MIDATIHEPLLIVTRSETGDYQRQFKPVFAKTFIKEGKDESIFFVSISVLKDTHEAVITNHIKPKKELGKILENGVVVFSSLSMNGIQTEDVQPRLSGTTTPSNKQVGTNNKGTNYFDDTNTSGIIKPIYPGLFVQDKASLEERYPSELPNKYYDHMTSVFRPGEIDATTLGEESDLHIIGRLITDKVDALLVESEDTNNEHPHITLATADGVKPIASNTEIAENPNAQELLYSESRKYVLQQ